MTQVIGREVYDVYSESALGADDDFCYGVAATADEAIALYKAGQSPETLASGYTYSAVVANGVWAVTMAERA